MTEGREETPAEQCRAIRPTPEQFRAAFGLGAEDGPIHPADAIGVPLAAIQALYGLIKENQRGIDELRAELALAERGLTPP